MADGGLDALEQEFADDGGASQSNQDVTKLKKCLMDEKHCPDILPYQKALVDELKSQMASQQNFIDEASENHATVDNAFTFGLYQMEIDRVKFVLVSYLRTRLAKIEKYHTHLMSEEQHYAKLSEQELLYVQRYAQLVTKHFDDIVLDDIPATYRRADPGTAETPNLDEFVFVRVLEDIGPVQVDGREELEMWSGHTHIIRYRPVQGLFEEGRLELI
jgi:GINS complex subunit 4